MKTIDNDIKTGEFKTLYLLYGEEVYLRNQYKNKLKTALIADEDTMNCSVYEGDGINPNEIIDLAETMPFLADRRVIYIEDSGFFKKGCDELAEYFSSVPDTTCIVFVEAEVDKRSKTFKSLQKNGQVVEFVRQTDEMITRWVVNRVKKEGKEITQNAFNAFINKTGNDMENIEKELEKLICYCLDKQTIEANDVEAITTEVIESKIFDMVDAITSHNQKKALDLYYDLLALKEPSMRIMYLITRQFNILLTVKVMAGGGSSDGDIAKKAGCPPFAVKKYKNLCRGYSMEQLKRAVSDGVDYEEQVKTGYLNDQIAVEMYISRYSK